MRKFLPLVMGLLLFGTVAARADDVKPNMSGTWKLDPARSQLDQTNILALVIDEQGGKIHVKETRGPDPQEDVSEFTCGTMGVDCPMLDGSDAKAIVSVYYNGPLLVVLKTHGRKGSSVEKQRLSLSPTGDALTVEIMHIEPEGKPERLVFSKAH